MFLSDRQIKEYQNNGAIIIKDVFKDWIEPLRKGFKDVLDNPSKHGRENVTDENGRFFAVSYTHLRAHETPEHLVCRLLLEKKKK